MAASKLSIDVASLVNHSLILSSCLEQPLSAYEVEVGTASAIKLKGWIVFSGSCSPRLILEFASYCVESALVHRHDVEAACNANFSSGSVLYLGYDIDGVDAQSFVGLKIIYPSHDGSYDEEQLIRIERQRLIKPLQGKHGWLYLDNDTNKSVDQFTGLHCLSPKHIHKWRSYLSDARKIHKDLQCDWRFLVAPAKEYVAGFFYPYMKGNTTTLEQLEAILDEQCPVETVNCIPCLTSQWNTSYSPVDTHWTDLGAYFVASTIADSLGHSDGLLAEILASARFIQVVSSGDLGSKMDPKVDCHIAKLDLSTLPIKRVFDNGVHNHGRIWIFEGLNSVSDVTLLVFGDSFATNLSPWLACLYSRVVYCHTSAGIDISILRREAPCHVILQTNSRFVGVVPSCAYSILEVATGKGHELNNIVYF
jgi:hypothetical protein